MTICEFCKHFGQDGTCDLGLKLPRAMSCREFEPTLEKFCALPEDFVSERQIVEMATYFGIKRTELKKVKVMSSLAENIRRQPAVAPINEVVADDPYPYASFNLRK